MQVLLHGARWASDTRVRASASWMSIRTDIGPGGNVDAPVRFAVQGFSSSAAQSWS